MSIFKRLFGKDETPKPATEPPQDPANDPNLIRVYDAYGRELFITKEQWRTDVLPGVLASSWNKPDELYQVIVGALHDGFRPDVVRGAEQLYRTDTNHERGACLWGVVLMEEGRLDEADRVLRDHVAQHGESGFVLTNVAKIQAKRGDDDGAMHTLWRALEVDPNQQNGLEWFVLEQRDRRGPAAMQDALERVAALPRSWRARVWLAREALGRGDPNEAVRLYEQALAASNDPVPADLLMNMSGDLGKAGQLQDVVRLTFPRFDAAHHGVIVGNNLMRALSDLGEVTRAAEILGHLYAQNRPDWKPTLSYWDTELAKLGIERIVPEPPEKMSVTMATVDAPVWLSEQSPAQAFFPHTPSGALRICFLGSSATYPDANDQRVQLADAPGRLSRALPLFLGEQARFVFAADAIVLVPWVKSGTSGFALSGVAWPNAQAADIAKSIPVPAKYVVTTHLEVGARWRATLRLIRVADADVVLTAYEIFDINAPQHAAFSLVRQLEQALASAGETHPVATATHYAVPRDELFADYLLRLEQLLAVRFSAMDDVAPGFLNGPREIMDGNIGLCLAAPKNTTTRVLLLQTWTSLRRVLPQIAAEFDDKIARLSREHPLDDDAHAVTTAFTQGRSAT